MYQQIHQNQHTSIFLKEKREAKYGGKHHNMSVCVRDVADCYETQTRQSQKTMRAWSHLRWALHPAPATDYNPEQFICVDTLTYLDSNFMTLDL